MSMEGKLPIEGEHFPVLKGKTSAHKLRSGAPSQDMPLALF